MGFLRCGLMSWAPKRPGDDIGGLDALSCEALRYPMESSVKYPERLVSYGFLRLCKYLHLQEWAAPQLDFLQIERRLWA